MKELLQTYSITDIIIILFMVFVALKEIISLFQYFKNFIKGEFNKEDSYNDKINEIIEKVDTLSEKYDQTMIEIKNMKEEYNTYSEKQNQKLAILLASDRDDIKGYIVEKHHFFTQQGWIDDFSMDVLTKRFEHYKDEGGNSYAKRLMSELDNLPNHPPKE